MHSFCNLFNEAFFFFNKVWSGDQETLSYRQHFLAGTGFLRSTKRSWKLLFVRGVFLFVFKIWGSSWWYFYLGVSICVSVPGAWLKLPSGMLVLVVCYEINWSNLSTSTDNSLFLMPVVSFSLVFMFENPCS